MNTDLSDQLLKELRIIKKLLATNILPRERQWKQIERLNSIGLTPKEIADALATTPNTVNVALAKIRKGRRGSGAKAGG